MRDEVFTCQLFFASCLLHSYRKISFRNIEKKSQWVLNNTALDAVAFVSNASRELYHLDNLVQEYRRFTDLHIPTEKEGINCEHSLKFYLPNIYSECSGRQILCVLKQGLMLFLLCFAFSKGDAG
jgi:hypothetical protein